MGRNSTNALCRRYAAMCMPGWISDTTQHWAGVVRKDLFGLVDCVLMSEDKIVFVQNCSEGSLSSHRNKIFDSGLAKYFLAPGRRLELWEWRKRKPKGKKRAKASWQMRLQELDSLLTFTEPSEWLGPLFGDDE